MRVALSLLLIASSACVSYRSAPENVTGDKDCVRLTGRVYERLDAGTGTAQLARAAYCACAGNLRRDGESVDDAGPIRCVKR